QLVGVHVRDVGGAVLGRAESPAVRQLLAGDGVQNEVAVPAADVRPPLIERGPHGGEVGEHLGPLRRGALLRRGAVERRAGYAAPLTFRRAVHPCSTSMSRYTLHPAGSGSPGRGSRQPPGTLTFTGVPSAPTTTAVTTSPAARSCRDSSS